MIENIGYKISQNTNFKSYSKDDMFKPVSDLIFPKWFAEKYNRGLKRLGDPNKECIPTEGENIMVFKTLDGFLTFLYEYCGFIPDELNELTYAGYKIYRIEYDCVCSGFSKLRGTLFANEIVEANEVSISELPTSCIIM